MLPPSDAPRLAIGVDTVEIARIVAVIGRHGERFLRRVYTPYERERYADRPLALAGRFAAKEAAAKALGTGIGPVGWHGIEIRTDDAGKPLLFLHHAAAALATARGFTEWHVSITHSRDLATAFVVGYRTGDEPR
jgi:holo-[acyl-carrier protein] synthase